MTRQIITVHLDESVEAVQALFAEHSFHHLLVTDRRRLIGVISDRDLLRNLSPFADSVMERRQDANLLKRRVHQIMRREPATVTADTGFCAAAQVMIEHHVSCLPVVDRRRHPIGIITWHDLLAAICPIPVEPATDEAEAEEGADAEAAGARATAGPMPAIVGAAATPSRESGLPQYAGGEGI